jgi:hypothetical protein
MITLVSSVVPAVKLEQFAEDVLPAAFVAVM